MSSAVAARPRSARSPGRWVAAALAVGLSLAAFAVGTPIPPMPQRWVTDGAGFLSPQARGGLDRELESFERDTGRQVVVYIGDTTGGVPIEDWAVRAFAAWKVGRKGLDDGLALFVFAGDRKVRIEVGYGLEATVTDALSSRIINEIIVPKIQAGDRDGALIMGVGALLSAVEPGWRGGGEAARGPGGAAPGPSLSLGQMILFGILAVAFLILLVTHPSLAIYLLFSILSGGRGGGGGGRSGGGGATGSW